MPFVGGSGITYYGNAGVPGGFVQYSNNKLQLDAQLNQKLDMITKGLSFKLKGSYNSLFGVTKTGARAMATYYPVLKSDGSIGYKMTGQTGQIAYSETTSIVTGKQIGRSHV